MVQEGPSRSVLVTGGAGFIGRWIVKRLIADGHRVAVLDSLENGSRENLAEFVGHPFFLGLIVGCVEDPQAVNRAFAATPDICIHAAAQINVHESLLNPAKAVRANVQGTWQVLEQCRARKAKFVLLSTCMVYAELRDRPAMDEQYAVEPRSPYAATKLAAEALAHCYYRCYGLPVVILRPFNTYGPFQKPGAEGGVVSVFLTRKLQGQTLPLYGGGTQTRDLLYVEDCADFIVRAALEDAALGQVINAGTGREVSVRELAEQIAGPQCVVPAPHPHPQAEIRRMCCAPEKAERILGWRPRFSLPEGLRHTEQWLKETALQPAGVAGPWQGPS